jgi:Ni/Co efflux regulator RcnB
MKTHLLAGIIISGALATSVAQAATSLSVNELYSGMSAAAIQKDQQANPAAERHSTTGKSTCSWHEAMNKADSLYAAYPGDEYVEKAYLAPANQSFVC